MNQMGLKQDSGDWFNYKFSFWFLVICIIIIVIGIVFVSYSLIYLGIIISTLIILIRFIKTAIELDR